MKIKEKIKKFSKKHYFLEQLYLKVSRIKSKFLRYQSDELFIKKRFKKKFGREIDLEHPKTFNEKLQWIKLYDHNPLYTTLVDKYKVREYVKERIGEKYLNRLLGVYDSFDDIDFKSLPNQFVIKCNHDSGTIVICKDKTKFNIKRAKKRIKSALKVNYYDIGREWPYKDVVKKIIIEEYISDESGFELKDYKFFCFDGKPQLMFIVSNRSNGAVADYYDMDFNKVNLAQGFPNSNKEWNKPVCFEEMKRLASILSMGIPEVRIDFYYASQKIIFGEMTFFDSGGFAIFNPEEWDLKLGNYIKLPE